MTIGILPASGSATRVRGIPKFCLPISENQSVLEWHVEKMLEVCDEVRVSTRSVWSPIVENLDLPIKLYLIEPSTMSDAVFKMARDVDEKFIVGMPDTFIAHTSENFYKKIVESKNDIQLASFKCTDDVLGRVGQINYEEDEVIEVVDKTPGCTFDRMWGMIAFNISAYEIDRNLSHPGLQLNRFIKSGKSVGHSKCQGEYIDIGKFSGIRELYRSI